MRASDRRIPAAPSVEPDDAPISRDTIPAPPASESHPGPLEHALDHALDTIPTPPPESGIVEPVVIPPQKTPKSG